MVRPYSKVFDGWSYVDIPVERADEMALLLHRGGGTFASTSEGGAGKRRFYLSARSAEVVQKQWRPEPEFDFDSMPHLTNATVEERIALLRWREDAVRAALAGAPLQDVVLPS